ncbi:MAG: DnaJ domain-containing protein [Cyclobacteriaceae bacterium]|nr:DnaJ domain-containing protein [Cyclobacteriaceae bacterium]
MKDYYKILRISRLASAADVKRAYRRLAVLFHPDKNSSPEALRLFQEVNEAHEVLSDPLKRSNYDSLLDGGGTVAQPAAPPGGWHRDPAYRRRQQQGYRPAKPGPSEKLLMMLHMLRFLRTASLVGLAWCLFLVVDYSLPSRVSAEKVLPEGHRPISWQLHHEPNVIVTDKGHHFPIPWEGLDYFPVGSEVEVITSRVLNVLVQVEAQDDKFVVDSLASIYQNMMIVPIVLLILSLAGLLVKQGIEFRFNLLVAIGILLIFNLIFLLFSIL